MFGHKFFGGSDADATIVQNPVVEASPMNDTATNSYVDFPVPWTCRTMTPVKRAPLGKMWGNDEWDSYGGPWG